MVGGGVARSRGRKDRLKTRARGLVFRSGAAAVEANLCVGTVYAAAVVFLGLLGIFGVGEEWAAEVVGDRW